MFQLQLEEEQLIKNRAANAAALAAIGKRKRPANTPQDGGGVGLCCCQCCSFLFGGDHIDDLPLLL